MFNKRKQIFITLAILGSFALGFWRGSEQVVCEVCPPRDINFSLFWEAYHELEENYVDKEKLDDKSIL